MNPTHRNIQEDWLDELCKRPNESEIPEKPFTFYRKEKGNMAKFWELLESSTIFQGAITFMLVITTCYLWITGSPVPSELWFANTVVIGFFFGSKSNQAAKKIHNIRGK